MHTQASVQNQVRALDYPPREEERVFVYSFPDASETPRPLHIWHSSGTQEERLEGESVLLDGLPAPGHRDPPLYPQGLTASSDVWHMVNVQWLFAE